MNDEEFDEEIMDQIKQTVRITIKTMEVYWEELQKSSLPDEIKKAVFISLSNKEEK